MATINLHQEFLETIAGSVGGSSGAGGSNGIGLGWGTARFLSEAGYSEGSLVQSNKLFDRNGNVIGVRHEFNLAQSAEFSSYSGNLFDPTYRSALQYYSGNFGYYNIGNADFRQDLLRSTAIVDMVQDDLLAHEKRILLANQGYMLSTDGAIAESLSEIAEQQQIEQQKEDLRKLFDIPSLEEALGDLDAASEAAKKIGIRISAVIESIRIFKKDVGSSGPIELSEADAKALIAGQTDFNQPGNENAYFAYEAAKTANQMRLVGGDAGLTVTLKWNDAKGAWVLNGFPDTLAYIARSYRDRANFIAESYAKNAESTRSFLFRAESLVEAAYLTGRNRNLNRDEGMGYAFKLRHEFEDAIPELMKKLYGEGATARDRTTAFFSHFNDSQYAEGGSGYNTQYNALVSPSQLARAYAAATTAERKALDQLIGTLRYEYLDSTSADL